MSQPVAVSPRALLVLLFAIVALAAAVAVVAVSLTRPEPADAASSDRAVVQQLKEVNKNVKTVRAAITGRTYPPSNLNGTLNRELDELRSYLDDICENLRDIGGSTSCTSLF